MCTETIATSLIPLDTILPEVCAFIIGFSCTSMTKTRSLAGLLADGVLADTSLNSPCPPIPPSNIRKEGVIEKSTETSNTKLFTYMKKGNVGMAKHFFKKY